MESSLSNTYMWFAQINFGLLNSEEHHGFKELWEHEDFHAMELIQCQFTYSWAPW